MIWTAVAFCLLVSFIFAGLEAGILSVNRVRLKHRVKLRDRAALRLERLLATPARLLVTVLIVTNLMNISAIILTTQELVHHFGTGGYFLSLVISLPVYLIGLELLPKSLFRRVPYRALAALAVPLRVADTLLAPVHFVSGRLYRTFLRDPASGQRKLFVAREDFKYLTIESERGGTLTHEERAMIHNVVDFRSITAQEVMIPMSAARTVPVQMTIPDFLNTIRGTNFERWPVVGENGRITGVIDTYDIALDGRRRGSIEPFQRRIVRASENEPAYSILRKLRAARVSVAVVLDEGGQALGIVFSEDLIKRLVSTAAA